MSCAILCQHTLSMHISFQRPKDAKDAAEDVEVTGLAVFSLQEVLLADQHIAPRDDAAVRKQNRSLGSSESEEVVKPGQTEVPLASRDSEKLKESN